MIFPYETFKNRPTRAEISLTNLKNNYQVVKSLIDKDVKVMAVVKANAYGHGILKISEELLKEGADYLGVAFLEEAVYLRKNGINAPIQVLGAINTDQISEFIEYGIDITSSSIDKSKAISDVAVKMNKTANVHLKIDTGMERIGVHWYNAEKFIDTTYDLPNINVQGIFSHFAKAESDEEFTFAQLERFNEIINNLKKKNRCPELVHLANSAGIINYKESHFNMVRPGIMLYGYNPNGYLPGVSFQERKLLPVMNFLTKVAFFKVCPPKTGISYNHTYQTSEQTRIVSLPVGYGDGYNRLLSNKASVVIRDEFYPIVGNICMDQTMVDLGADGTAFNGDDVLLFGEMGNQKISLEDLCDSIGTITYEFLCNIAPRVPRIYIT